MFYFHNFHPINIRVEPCRDVEAVQLSEIHPVATLGLPVDGPRVGAENVPDGGSHFPGRPQPLAPGQVDLEQVGLSSAGENHPEILTVISHPGRTAHTTGARLGGGAQGARALPPAL